MIMKETNTKDIDGTAIKILLVEDHEFTRIGLKLSLEQMTGLKIVGEAENGEEGLRKAIELCPDVVLMDIEMPVMDGIEATRQIKERESNVKVIMLTSHKLDQTSLAALSAGANGYCLKNISAQQLATVITMVTEGGIWLDPGIANCVLSNYSANHIQTAAEVTSVKPKGNISLSPRETEVLRLVADGLSNQKIAERLGLGLETIKTHMRHIMEKLAVSDRTEAAVKAMREGRL